MDGTQKLPQRLLDAIRWHLAQGSDFSCLALGVAAWMRYVGGQDEQGQVIEINDPLRERLAERVGNSREGAERVLALLQLETVFGRDLPDSLRFVKAVTDAYLTLLAQGARATVAALPVFENTSEAR
ncbi:Mannitol 2-dehydrogenase [compost metagenome]